MKTLFMKLDIDKALLWVLINKAWAVFKGPVSLYFIVKYLSLDEQGIWFTFISLGALSVFAEMGFTSIITQFVSHEYAHLKESKGFIYGKKSKIDKLFSLMEYAVKFYLIVVPFSIIVLLLVGNWFLDGISSDIFILWILYSVAGGVQLLVSLVQAIIQGFDKVELIQKNIFVGSLLVPISTWSLLYFDYGVSSLIISSIFSIIVMCFLLYKKTRKIWIQLIKNNYIYKYSWFSEIVKLQSKYAISWIAGYFVFHFSTPMIFKYKGAELAGQFGVTYALLRTIGGVSLSWIDTKVPRFNMLVAKKDRSLLNKIFLKSSKISFSIYIFLILTFILIVYMLQYYDFYYERFLEMNLIIVFALSEIVMMSTVYLSKYVRLHKAEPFYWSAIIVSFLYLVTISLLQFDNFTIQDLFLIILGINLFVVLPLVVYISNRFLNVYYKGN